MEAKAAYDLADKNGKRQGMLWNGDVGLQKWRSALAKANDTLVNLGIIGDSITEGAYSDPTVPGNWITKGYVGLIRQKLATLYADVGLGAIPYRSPWGAALWTFTGSWNGSARGFGYASSCKISITNGDTASINFNGTGIVIQAGKGSFGGTFTVAIDGGVAQTFDTNGSIDGSAGFTVSGLTNGAHTCLVTSTVTASKEFHFIGSYEIKGTNGIRVNNCGVFGTQTSAWVGFGLDAAINHFNPALTIVSLTANDYINQQTLVNYSNNLQTIITRAKQYGDVLLFSNGACTSAGAITQDQYVNAMRDLVLKNNCAFFDYFNRWGSASTYNSMGLLYDSVHPNAYGHKDMANSLLNVLLETR